MKTLHRWLINAELILVVIPATMFLALSFFLLVPYSFQVPGRAVAVWLLWSGGSIGCACLWVTYVQIRKDAIGGKRAAALLIGGTVGTVANLFPFVMIATHEHRLAVFVYMLLYLPSLVWLHWGILLWRKFSTNSSLRIPAQTGH